MFQTPVAALAALSLLGCTSMQVMEQPAAAAVKDHLKVGEQVNVLTRTQHHYDLKVTSVDEASFTGRDSADRPWAVRYDQIEQIEARQFSGWRTAGLVGGIVAASAVALAILLHGLDDDIDDAVRDSFGG
ncbi:MAG: hypothetical protein JWQ90_741 [Hydrocarboniphaga sp.]|uniref:hypothetical protein n=1 Tax=Hydrocarboniphaga sp. TaxID=2033016 RepID=UPI0026068F20|nr:hypothetical protein [Hydrocarboniphaga sp.]MDB5968291.1 hypothetical protein [Hydrocarboniphaga sp.]